MAEINLPLLAAVINDTSVSLMNAIKYVYLISDEDFYNVNVKDIFKVALKDVRVADNFYNLGLKLNPQQLGEMAKPEFNKLGDIIRYSYAVRLPFLKRQPDCPLNDKMIKALYELVGGYGMYNPDEIITLTLKQSFKLVRRRQTEPAYSSDWLRRWIFSYGNELSAINNRNLFVLGCVDALFPLYYSALTDKLTEAMR